MGRGAKKASKLVKSEKQKTIDREDEPSVPSPIPEEAESGLVAQDSLHVGDPHPWGADPIPTWHTSGAPGRATSPRPDSAAPETHSQNFSWAGQSAGASYDQESKHYRSSPYQGSPARILGSDSLDFERDVPRSNSESGLEYISEEPSGMVPSSNIDQDWTSTAQTQSGAPFSIQDQPLRSGPAFGVYATSFSNPPAVPNPRPPPPNVVSKASDAAARLDKAKKVEMITPAPQQSQYVPPTVAAWHSWIRSDTYRPKVEAEAPPPVMPQAPPLQLPPANHPDMPNSVLKGPRGVWGMRHSKSASVGTGAHPPNVVMPGAAVAWNQRGPSADGGAGYQTKHSYDESNDGAWAQANGGGWYGENKKRHGKSKTTGAWDGKRSVQWEEDDDDDESFETEDDGWGEADDDGGGGDWEKSWGKKNNAWSNAEGQLAGMVWPKQDNGWSTTGWDQSGWNHGTNDWGGHPSSTHGMGDEGKKGNKIPPGGDAIRAAVSAQQRAQIFNSLLNMTDQKQGNHAVQRLQRSDKPMSKMKQGKENQRQTLYSTGWGLEDEQRDVREESEAGKGDRTRSSPSNRASAAWEGWGGGQDPSRYSMPSLTLSYAYKESKTRLDHGSQSKLNDIAKIRFHESKGVAFHSVHNAFFSQARLARDRIYWVFSPDKDERVRTALSWIQEMSYGLGTLALHKFLQHRERGALLINADYNPPDKPKDFAVDYLAFDDLQKSFDKTLQTSVISYDPTLQAIVFVFLPSKSGNSIAIWRRKLLVPNNTRLRFQSELDIALSGLKEPKDYVVFVDEVPNKKKDLPDAPSVPEKSKPKKRKWWQFFKTKS